MPANQKIRIPAGDTRLVIVDVKDDLGQPVDLQGASISWRLARRRTDIAAIARKELGEGIELDPSVQGRFRFRIEAADSEVPAGDYFHSARASFQDGSVSTLFAQYLTILDVI